MSKQKTQPATYSVHVDTLPGDHLQISVGVKGFGESRYILQEGPCTEDTLQAYESFLLNATTMVEGYLFLTLNTAGYMTLLEEIKTQIHLEIGRTVAVQALMNEINNP